MKKVIFLAVFLGIIASVLAVAYFYKENQAVSRILNEERYNRMLAEEELLKGDYRIKKLEADLQTTQVKLSRIQESFDRERDEKSYIKAQLNKLAETKEGLEKNLKNALDKQETLQARVESAALAEELAAVEAARLLAESKADAATVQNKGTPVVSGSLPD